MVEVRRRLAIPAEVDRLAEIRAVVREIASACEAPADCIDDLIQAVDEAATNIIVHGYCGTPGVIEMTAELVADDIVITLMDTAPTFDPTSVPPPDLITPPERRAETSFRGGAECVDDVTIVAVGRHRAG